MKFDFPYPGYEQIAPVEVPDANLMGVYAPRTMGEVDEEAVLGRGFVAPFGAPRLREAVGPHDRVLILTVMGVAENSMRLRMEEAARLVGLHYIANLVSDYESQIVGCFVGDVVQAHRAGCKLSREINAAPMPRRADIVLIDSHPADRDFWQSAKGAYSGTMAVRDGGTLIVVAPNPEGVADNHPNVLEIGYRPYAEIVRMVKSGEVNDVVGAAVLADIAQIVDRADCIMVSPGVTREEAERIGFRYAATAQDALEMAFEQQGHTATVAVLRHGGHILPLVDGEATEGGDWRTG